MQLQQIEINDNQSQHPKQRKKSSKNDISSSIKKQQSKVKVKVKQKQKYDLNQSSNRKPLIPNQLQDNSNIPPQDIEQQEYQQPKFYKNRKKRYVHKDLQQNVAYPQATIREYLNQKRTTQNKCCHVLFCIFMIVILMLLGVGFFYGSYSSLGTFVNGGGVNVKVPDMCAKYVSEDYTECLTNCDHGKLYLQKVCTTTVPYNPTFSTALDKQITMYTLKQCIIPIVYGSFISLVISSICFVLLICFAKMIYFYIAFTFVMLLGFAFYLLKSVKTNLGQYDEQSIFYTQAGSIQPLAYILMAIYLIMFPLVLFSPSKIKSAVRIISKLSNYFSKMSSVNFFSYLVIYLTWGLTMLEIFLVMNMFSSGQPAIEKDSFMYVFNKVSLSHPAVLVVHFFGIYWFFGTVVSWHKHFTSNAMCLWYFEEGKNLYPVSRGLKRSWYSLGTSAIDSLLVPIQWLMQIIYSMCKLSDIEIQQNNNNDETNQSQQSTIQCCFCFQSIRQCFNTIYCKVNCHSAASASLTNYSFKQSCEISAVTFSFHNHRFFNIGNTLSLLLTLFNCLVWIIVCYGVLYSQVYSTTTPPPITSLSLPIICIFLSSLAVGSLFSNIYTAAIDCLIFCFLLEKKNNVTNTRNQVKDVLEQMFNDDELTSQERVEMFQYEED